MNNTFNNITNDSEIRENIGLDILSYFLITCLSLFLLGFVVTLARIFINECFENNRNIIYIDFEHNIEKNKIKNFEIIQSNNFKDNFIESGFKQYNIINDICSICLENIKNNKVELINCNHHFHKQCLIDWFRKGKINCPNCRNDH